MDWKERLERLCDFYSYEYPSELAEFIAAERKEAVREALEMVKNKCDCISDLGCMGICEERWDDKKEEILAKFE